MCVISAPLLRVWFISNFNVSNITRSKVSVAAKLQRFNLQMAFPPIFIVLSTCQKGFEQRHSSCFMASQGPHGPPLRGLALTHHGGYQTSRRRGISELRCRRRPNTQCRLGRSRSRHSNPLFSATSATVFFHVCVLAAIIICEAGDGFAAPTDLVGMRVCLNDKS